MFLSKIRDFSKPFFITLFLCSKTFLLAKDLKKPNRGSEGYVSPTADPCKALMVGQWAKPPAAQYI